MNFKLIVAMIKTNVTDEIVTAAKAAGGTGATIIPARGTGIHEAKTFFGLTLEAQTDVVLFLLEASLVAPVLDSISNAGRLAEAGTGIAFVIDVEQAIGLESQLEYFRQAAEKYD
jgi:nitrogen regulatory protein PII